MQINQMKVVDATKPITVKVTDNDVKKGATKDPSCCAGALACLRIPNITEARVHLGRTYLRQGNKWVRYLTPKSMRTEIVAFDRGAAFAPGVYTLTPLGPTERAARGKQHGSKTNQTTPKSKQKKRKPYHVVSGVRHHGANR